MDITESIAKYDNLDIISMVYIHFSEPLLEREVLKFRIELGVDIEGF
jgi:hypothetical protein